MKTSQVITNTAVARRLIQLGFKVIDIKPNKDNPVKTSFVFEYTPVFQVAWTQTLELLHLSSPEVEKG